MGNKFAKPEEPRKEGEGKKKSTSGIVFIRWYTSSYIYYCLLDYIIDNLPSSTTGFTQQDVFFCSGIFINTDDGYESYVEVDEFKYYNFSIQSWVDLTEDYKTKLLV